MTTAPSTVQKRKVSIFVKLFVLFHLTAITVWAMPQPPSAIKQHKVLPGGTEWINYWDDQYLRTFPPIDVYLHVTGFWQYWDMFAPNPAHTDQYGDAEVVYRDGKVKRYAYPRIYSLPIWQKFFKERYRKFYERAGSDDFLYLWPTFGLRVALLNDDPKNPPVRVKLYRHWRPVAAPGKPQQKEYNSYSYFTYVVDQKELARLRSL